MAKKKVVALKTFLSEEEKKLPQIFEASGSETDSFIKNAAIPPIECSSSLINKEEPVSTIPQDGTQDGKLPSKGSANHACGGCEPCIFHRRGKCMLGMECEYCHLPHDKPQTASESAAKAVKSTPVDDDFEVEDEIPDEEDVERPRNSIATHPSAVNTSRRTYF